MKVPDGNNVDACHLLILSTFLATELLSLIASALVIHDSTRLVYYLHDFLLLNFAYK